MPRGLPAWVGVAWGTEVNFVGRREVNCPLVFLSKFAPSSIMAGQNW